MLKRALVGLALLVPQVASAADLPYRHTYVRHRVVRHVVEENHVIRCTTTDLLLFTYANCGQSLDPLAVAAGR